jgi:hypothetical protein
MHPGRVRTANLQFRRLFSILYKPLIFNDLDCMRFDGN